MNLEFRSPCLKDKELIQKILLLDNNINSESTFGTSYIWSDTYDTKICILDSVLLQKSNGYNLFPKGIQNEHELKNILDLLMNNSIGSNGFNFTSLLKHETDSLETLFPGKFKFTPTRNDFDYIYSTKELAELKGKKYHSKRNHISKFNKLYNWHYSNEINKEKTLDFFKKWFDSDTHEGEVSSIHEFRAISKAIRYFSELNLFSGTITVDDEIVACTIAEKINDDVLLIHFEKALSTFEGAYSVINNEFCKSKMNEFKLVNREEDMGILGLRKSKLSYKPKFLLKKYTAIEVN